MMLANSSVAMDEPRAIRLASATIASGRSADQWMTRTHFLCCSNVPQATTATCYVVRSRFNLDLAGGLRAHIRRQPAAGEKKPRYWGRGSTH